MDIDAIYAAVVDGTGAGGDLPWTRRELRQRALHLAKTGSPDERYGALRVAAILGPRDGLPISHQLVTDPEPRVRTLAFNQAVAARAEGIPTVRTAAGGVDPELACAALDLLIRWVDGQAMTIAWRGLASPHAGVRARSARLLGQVAGMGVTVDLRRIAEHDDDPDARAAAAEALLRIAGEVPRAQRQAWWDDEPATTAAPVATTEPATTEPPHPDPLPRGGGEGESRAKSMDPGPSALALAEPDPPRTASGWAAPPRELPTEIRPLVRLIGLVAPEDRGPATAAVQALGHGPWSDLMLGWTAGADAALGRGLAWTAAELGRTGALGRTESMMQDPDPSVRAAAVRAVGALGGAGAVPGVARAMFDPAPAVAAAAVHALVALAERVGRPDLARDQLRRVGGAVPDEVAAALAEVRPRLERPR